MWADFPRFWNKLKLMSGKGMGVEFVGWVGFQVQREEAPQKPAISRITVGTLSPFTQLLLPETLMLPKSRPPLLRSLSRSAEARKTSRRVVWRCVTPIVPPSSAK